MMHCSVTVGITSLRLEARDVIGNRYVGMWVRLQIFLNVTFACSSRRVMLYGRVVRVCVFLL